MNARIDKDKHPNRRRHVAHTGPHAHHGASMVVSLESRAQTALGEDDEGVEDLVELAQVENPAVESQALVPDAAQISAAGSAIASEGDSIGVRGPAALVLVVVDGVAQASRPMKPSHAVDKGTETSVGGEWADDTAAHDTNHSVEGPGRVDGEENIVGNDKGMEETSL